MLRYLIVTFTLYRLPYFSLQFTSLSLPSIFGAHQILQGRLFSRIFCKFIDNALSIALFCPLSPDFESNLIQELQALPFVTAMKETSAEIFTRYALTNERSSDITASLKHFLLNSCESSFAFKQEVNSIRLVSQKRRLNWLHS